MNIALFYVWEDARVWVHGTQSSGVILANWGQYPVFFYPESSQGTELGGSCSDWWFDSHNTLFTDMMGNILHPHFFPSSLGVKLQVQYITWEVKYL